MPELPEVETIRRYLVKDILNKKIQKIDVRVPKQFIGSLNTVIGRKIIEIQRHGKILTLKLYKLDELYNYLNIHLKLTGQLIFGKKEVNTYRRKIPHSKSRTLPANTTRIIIYFIDGSALYFNDLRKFGWLKVTDKPEEPKGIDVLSPLFTLKYFSGLVASSKKPIKLLLMDQDKIAGLGNIYANDALWLARINPQIQISKCKSKNYNEKLKKLFLAIKSVINEGLKYNGASDESYILPDTSVGNYQSHFKVYGRENKPCARCKTLIKRIKQAGRSSFYCPKCQAP